jgi:hypothetical protein
VKRGWAVIGAMAMLAGCDPDVSADQAERAVQSEDANAKAQAVRQVIDIDDGTRLDTQDKRLRRLEAEQAAEQAADYDQRIATLENQMHDLQVKLAEKAAQAQPPAPAKAGAQTDAPAKKPKGN